MLMSAKHTLTALVIAVFAAALTGSSTCRATIIEVPADQPTIQAGIGAAATGDTVLVAPDTYSETIDFLGKSIVVGSHYLTTGDPAYTELTIIDGGGTQGPLASFTSGEDSLSMLVGMTLQHGRAPQGGAVFCSGGSPRISDCVLLSNEALNGGGGIYATEADPIIENCHVDDNRAIGSSGGALYVNFGSARITGCVFSGNSADATGGAMVCKYSSPVITDNVFDANSSSGNYAGGIYSRDCTAVIARNVFSNNSADGIAGGLFY
jgi:predicted outer membrane repeat protein